MKRLIKTLIPVALLGLAACSSSPPVMEEVPTHSGGAPLYLSIPQFKSCLSTRQEGTASWWCMPASQPEACPTSSWQALNALQGRERLPQCPALAR